MGVSIDEKVFFAAVLTVRAGLFAVDIRALIFGNSNLPVELVGFKLWKERYHNYESKSSGTSPYYCNSN